MKSFTTTLDVLNSPIWGYNLPIPPEIAEEFKTKSIKRVVCEVNGKLKIHSAILSSNGYYYVLINKQNVKQLGLVKDEPILVTLTEETSKYGMPMAEEMQEVFAQEPEALSYFDKLTPGKQRNLIHLVNKVKNQNSRISKALAISHHLKEVKGELDFKMFNQTIKDYNQLNK